MGCGPRKADANSPGRTAGDPWGSFDQPASLASVSYTTLAASAGRDALRANAANEGAAQLGIKFYAPICGADQENARNEQPGTQFGRPPPVLSLHNHSTR